MITSEDVFRRINKRKKYKNHKKEKANWIGNTLRKNCLLQLIIEGKIQRKRGRGTKRYDGFDDGAE